MTRVLALDVGTSSVRARVYDERGRAVTGVEAQTRYELVHGHDGRAEFDPDHLVAATTAAHDEVLREAGGGVDAVGAGCFWHSVMAIDRRGRPLMPLLTWRDTRAADAADQLARRLDPEDVHRRTGCALHPSYWPAKLAWLAGADPDTFRSAERFVSFPDYLDLGRTGELRTSLSMASGTGLLDVAAGRWDLPLLEALGLSEDRLPPISDEPAGEATPWFPALGDGACSNVGSGCVTLDRAALMVGTSGALRVVRDPAAGPPRPGLFLYRLDDRRAVEGGALSDGGNLYAWLGRTLHAVEQDGLADLPPDGHGLTFLTLLGGERSPGWNAKARGAIAGLSFDTTPLDIVQAAFEGVAYGFAEIADRLPGVREVVATGAALLSSPDWIQIVADVLGVPVTASGVDEGSARGAGVVTLERLGLEPDEAPLGDVYQPRPERTAIYREALERRRALYGALIGSR